MINLPSQEQSSFPTHPKCVRHLYATHLGRGPLWCTSFRVQITTKDSLWSGVDLWFSRNRPCDRLLHNPSENSPLSASGRALSANSEAGRAVWRGLPASSSFHSSFCPRRPSERHRLFRIRVYGNACCPFNSFLRSPGSLSNRALPFGANPERWEQPLHHYSTGHYFC